ncbi:MAG: hypothetical protein ISS57_07400 [Anaerolineales bacterium]|nr:hypothetical protein [Anaerolineales bacterium]
MKRRFPLHSFLIITLIEGIFSFLWLLFIPSDPENAWILGLSITRVILLAGMLLLLLPLAILTFKAYKNVEWYQRVTQKRDRFLSRDEYITIDFLIPIVGTLGGIYFLITTLTTSNLHTQGYFIRLAPIVLWLTVLSIQSIIYLFYWNTTVSKAYLKHNGFALLLIFITLGLGLALHLYLGNPDREEIATYSPKDNVTIDIEDQDIYLVYKEGYNLLQGKNPYARAAETTELRWNNELPTYLPVIYYGSWLTHLAGLQEIDQWLNVWRGVFLFFNLCVAYLIFHIAHHRYHITTLGIFGALFWLFNRWNLHVTTIYHFNFIPIFFLLLSLSLHSKHKITSYILFGLSLSIKHNAIFLIPIYLIWAWQDDESQSIKNVVIAGLSIAGIPLIASLPFIITSPLGFTKSMLISLTRYPETHLGVLSLDALLGWVGFSAKIPLVIMVLLVYLLSWQRKLESFTAGLLIMLIFVNFHSVLFRHYLVWIIPLLPLAVCETMLTPSKVSTDPPIQDHIP